MQAPEKRPTTTELLRHPLIKGMDSGSDDDTAGSSLAPLHDAKDKQMSVFFWQATSKSPENICFGMEVGQLPNPRPIIIDFFFLIYRFGDRCAWRRWLRAPTMCLRPATKATFSAGATTRTASLAWVTPPRAARQPLSRRSRASLSAKWRAAVTSRRASARTA